MILLLFSNKCHFKRDLNPFQNAWLIVYFVYCLQILKSIIIKKCLNIRKLNTTLKLN